MTDSPARTIALDEIDARSARRLLRLCETRHPSPAVHLVDRLLAAGGKRWARSELEAFKAPSTDNGLAILLKGSGGRPAAEALKREGKQGMASASEKEDQARAVLLYLAAVASALVHHDAMISSRNVTVLTDLFMDVAEAIDGPIQSAFLAAIEAAILFESAPSRLRRID